jgi:hypothetical protein
MHLYDETPLEFDEDFAVTTQPVRASSPPLAARRSIERLIEQKALRHRLRDELDMNADLDSLQW